ncbi:MAG TPA: molybdopterin-dependent oxidoreductase [Acidimicrobiales bacterium]|nr:molybdopterin-dependent oxidoreductase [Acidimicrobiales bacterium]
MASPGQSAPPPSGTRRRIAAATARAEQESAKVEARFTSRLHDEWVASVLGITLGVAFTVCFLTGLLDYMAQHPPSWFHLPARPVNLYRVTEGVHVVTGIATIPLLLAKLWTVWPKLFAWPPLQGAAQALERLSLIPLVGGSLFLLFTGVANIDYWYTPMPFFFPTAHFWTAWMVVGALVIHVGAKWVTAGDALARGSDPGPEPAVPGVPGAAVEPAAPSGGLTRRGFVGAVFASAGVLVLTVAGETVAPLRRLAVLAPRNPTIGPQGIPVNQTAVEANVTTSAVDPAYRLVVSGNCRHPRAFTLAELAAMPQRAAGLPITCVEGWSASASWRGVSVAHLLSVVGAAPGSPVRVESLEAPHRLYSSSVVDGGHTSDPDTLLALEMNGQPLHLDHGYPLRLIAPDRPGVLQTKWVAKVVVL